MRPRKLVFVHHGTVDFCSLWICSSRYKALIGNYGGMRCFISLWREWRTFRAIVQDRNQGTCYITSPSTHLLRVMIGECIKINVMYFTRQNTKRPRSFYIMHVQLGIVLRPFYVSSCKMSCVLYDAFDWSVCRSLPVCHCTLQTPDLRTNYSFLSPHAPAWCDQLTSFRTQ